MMEWWARLGDKNWYSDSGALEYQWNFQSGGGARNKFNTNSDEDKVGEKEGEGGQGGERDRLRVSYVTVVQLGLGLNYMGVGHYKVWGILVQLKMEVLQLRQVKDWNVFDWTKSNEGKEEKYLTSSTLLSRDWFDWPWLHSIHWPSLAVIYYVCPNCHGII